LIFGGTFSMMLPERRFAMTHKSKKTVKPEERTLFVVLWQESERGLGKRPDGYSLHKSRVDVNTFISDFDTTRSQMQSEDISLAQGMYIGVVDEEIYQMVMTSGEKGHRFPENNWPPQKGKPRGQISLIAIR
jgi:hypothetical protein